MAVQEGEYRAMAYQLAVQNRGLIERLRALMMDINGDLGRREILTDSQDEELTSFRDELALSICPGGHDEENEDHMPIDEAIERLRGTP